MSKEKSIVFYYDPEVDGDLKGQIKELKKYDRTLARLSVSQIAFILFSEALNEKLAKHEEKKPLKVS